MKHFETILISLLNELKSCNDNRTRIALRKSIRRVFQYYTEILPRLVSVEADEYNTNNANLDLQTIDAFHKRRGDLVLEHTTPIMYFIDCLLILPQENWIETIKGYSRCCWVTKEEDMRLKKMGFNTKRIDGWKKCYEMCNISLK